MTGKTVGVPKVLSYFKVSNAPKYDPIMFSFFAIPGLERIRKGPFDNIMNEYGDWDLNDKDLSK